MTRPHNNARLKAVRRAQCESGCRPLLFKTP